MSFFTLKPGRSIWREIMDQSLHMFLAALHMALFVFQIPVWAAAILSLGFGVLRELEQHEWKSVGTQDLFFWAVACAIFTVIYWGMSL